MVKDKINLSASVHQRLLNTARESSRPFNELLQYFAIERFIYRLSKSPFADQFILKGALMFFVWYVLSDRHVPYTDQARINGLMLPISPRVSGNLTKITEKGCTGLKIKAETPRLITNVVVIDTVFDRYIHIGCW